MRLFLLVVKDAIQYKYRLMIISYFFMLQSCNIHITDVLINDSSASYICF